MKCDFLIVGAGFYGSVLAERISNELKKNVIVIDKRDHIGGNCYSKIDSKTGIEYHLYGSHIFHTSNSEVWNYINKFTEFNNYNHQVLSNYRNKIYQMPINLETINSFYKKNLKPFEVESFLEKKIKKNYHKNPSNLEEHIINQIGRDLYDAFIKNYTIKQWGEDPKKLPKSIIKRLPIRNNYNETYFLNAKWQGIPVNGYTEIFEKLLSNKRINIILNKDYLKIKDKFQVKYFTIYTGGLDKYFDNVYGELGWRTIFLEKEILRVNDYQGNSVINFPEKKYKFTRIHEPKHFHPERKYKKNNTIIFKEYSGYDPSDPFYPISSKKNRLSYLKYLNLVKKEKSLIIGGRLADYAYYDMDMTIHASLNKFKKIRNLI